MKYKFKFKGKRIEFISTSGTFFDLVMDCISNVKSSGMYSLEEVDLICRIPLGTIYKMCSVIESNLIENNI